MDQFADTLIWAPDLGYGKHTREPMSYEGPYFAKYLAYDRTEMGAALTAARIAFVEQHMQAVDSVIDIGIGGGRFVKDSGCWGYDVNPEAVQWLKGDGRYRDPYGERSVGAVTCWDSLEHMTDPAILLAQVRRWVFLSIPIFTDLAHCQSSKHYRPGEHIWYFTDVGLCRYMAARDFRLVRSSDIESRLGREGIVSYAFIRNDRRVG